MPPIHPIFVHFTAALGPASVASDIMGRWLKKSSLTSVGFWAAIYAAAITPITVFTGWIWLRSMPGMDASLMTLHKWLGLELSVTLILLAWWRFKSRLRPGGPALAYLVIASATMLALALQGHIGGMMTFEPGSVASAPQEPSSLPWMDHVQVKD